MIAAPGITFPRTLEEATHAQGEFRAGGTDLQERRRSGVSTGPLVDLTGLTELRHIAWGADGSARFGALVPMATIAEDPRIRAAYPGLAAAAGGLATPQIRAVGTLGGNLLQRSRCWYFRQPSVHCFKKGGSNCPARAGDHLYDVCFDLGPCIAPHPSTLAAALLAYDAQIEVEGQPARPVAALYGDGSDGRHDHQLAAGQVLTAVVLGVPLPDERAVYFRAISRALAEWPLAEVVVRLAFESGSVSFARVAVGGVAPIPLRLPAVEAALIGQAPTPEVLDRAANRATDGANPLPSTAYKVRVLYGAVLETLQRAALMHR
jgi:xanthine dehydrogenase YagS FAD-binding subunit